MIPTKIILLTGCLAIATLTGCATLSHGSNQNITIETANDNNSGQTQCNIKNEEGTWTATPNSSTNIHRDGNEMEVQCENNKQTGVTHVKPKFNLSYLAIDFIILDACIISCVVDGINNAFYEYPSLISVPMQDSPK
ncbi:MAG: hypothetical protein HOP02_12795 [Methylococcaceae bacterium]|nr:hypothetical protein [Methylococcaceae bacterium]